MHTQDKRFFKTNDRKWRPKIIYKSINVYKMLQHRGHLVFPINDSLKIFILHLPHHMLALTFQTPNILQKHLIHLILQSTSEGS